MSTFTVPTFPYAQQAQIIRANQRDIYHISTLREQADSVLRSWLGTRWLTRWAKEVELVVKLVYYGLATARATQTFGEEYTAIWPSSSLRHHSRLSRAALVLLPTLPGYLLSRCSTSETLASRFPHLSVILKRLPSSLEVLAELNLAVFYLQGAYYSLSNRILKVRHISSVPENPLVRPPSYALLGVMLAVRLVHRLVVFLRTRTLAKGLGEEATRRTSDTHETFLDKRAVSYLLGPEDPEGVPAKPAEEDEGTMLDISAIPPALRAGRNCTLCLEERTDTCSTECGHLFCWSCIVGWGREKAECPLCRQSLNLTRLIPIYNL